MVCYIVFTSSTAGQILFTELTHIIIVALCVADKISAKMFTDLEWKSYSWCYLTDLRLHTNIISVYHIETVRTSIYKCVLVYNCTCRGPAPNTILALTTSMYANINTLKSLFFQDAR